MFKKWILIFLLPLLAVGCKQGVEFAPAPNETLDQGSGNGGSNAPQGPVVNIMQAPSNHKLNKGTQVVFEVVPGDNEIDYVECYVDSVKVNCDWSIGVIDIEGLPLGPHSFSVQAVDVEGLKGDAEENWSIYNNFQKFSDLVSVDAQTHATDILFVIDNSSSMWDEQKEISKRFEKFIDEIEDIDWHIGITTTDTRTSKDWSDGRLHAFPNGDYFLTPRLGKKKAQKQFEKHVRRDESGYDTEKGIKATYRSIERSLNPRRKVDRELAKFFRQDAALAVVVVSDEDESGVEEESKVNNLLNLVKESWGANKIFQWNSIIVHTQQCLNASFMHRTGHKYAELTRKTNGLLGDICAKNYSEMLTDLGKGVANLKRVHKLECVPQDIDGDNQVDLEITSLSGKKLPGYTRDQETITFDEALNAGDYNFEYYCLEE